MTDKTNACPRCDTPVSHAPGIGDFCPNRGCDARDDLRLDWRDRAPSEADIFSNKMREIARTSEDEMVSDTAKNSIWDSIPFVRTVRDTLMYESTLAPDQKWSAPVTQLKVSEVPHKQELLDLIEELRAGVEDGSVISLVAIPIHPNKTWSTRSAGEVSMVGLSAMLGTAWLDATNALRDE